MKPPFSSKTTRFPIRVIEYTEASGFGDLCNVELELHTGPIYILGTKPSGNPNCRSESHQRQKYLDFNCVFSVDADCKNIGRGDMGNSARVNSHGDFCPDEFLFDIADGGCLLVGDQIDGRHVGIDEVVRR